MVSPIVHFQVASPQPEQTKTFLREVFDWDIGGGTLSDNQIDTGWADDIVVAGSLFPLAEGAQAFSQVFVRVDDLPGTLSKARERGATVTVEPTDLPTGTTIAVIRSPEGISFGLVQQ